MLVRVYVIQHDQEIHFISLKEPLNFLTGKFLLRYAEYFNSN